MGGWSDGIAPTIRRWIFVATIFVSLNLIPSADAGTWPGANGWITFEHLGKIWIVNPDLSEARVLADGWKPSWSPDGNWIAFASERDNDIDLYVIRADGTGEKQVTNNTAVDEYMPSWYDHDTLLFKAGGFEHTDPSDRQIVTVDIGETPTGVYMPIRGPVSPGDNSLAEPERSSLGDLVFVEFYFVTVNTLKTGVFTASGGGTPTLVSTSGQTASSAGWSPNGQNVVYSEAVPNTHDSDIFTNNGAGGAPFNVTNTPSRRESSPRYSPDGKKIVFSDGEHLYVIDANGENEYKLVEGIGAYAPDWGIVPGSTTPPTTPPKVYNNLYALLKIAFTSKIKKLKKQFKKAKSGGKVAKAKKIKAQIKKFKKKLRSL